MRRRNYRHLARKKQFLAHNSIVQIRRFFLDLCEMQTERIWDSVQIGARSRRCNERECDRNSEEMRRKKFSRIRQTDDMKTIRNKYNSELLTYRRASHRYRLTPSGLRPHSKHT